jgi:hypothetical protein
MLRDPVTGGVLRSSLWAQPEKKSGAMKRLVTWTAHRVNEQFVFTGGNHHDGESAISRLTGAASDPNPDRLHEIRRF